MIALHFVVPIGQLLTSWPFRIACGGILVAAGVALNIWADALFKRAGTSVKPLEATTALIVQGPFAFSRHPMYLGMLLILGGSAVTLGSVSPWLAIPVFMWKITRGFVVAEETKLEATFGAQYVEYKRKVRRWL